MGLGAGFAAMQAGVADPKQTKLNIFLTELLPLLVAGGAGSAFGGGEGFGSALSTYGGITERRREREQEIEERGRERQERSAIERRRMSMEGARRSDIAGSSNRDAAIRRIALALQSNQKPSQQDIAEAGFAPDTQLAPKPSLWYLMNQETGQVSLVPEGTPGAIPADALQDVTANWRDVNQQGASMPSEVATAKYLQGLTPEDRENFLAAMKDIGQARNPPSGSPTRTQLAVLAAQGDQEAAEALALMGRNQTLEALGGMNPQQFQRAQTIAAQFDSHPAVKSYVESVNRYATVKRIIDIGVGGPGDLAMVFEFMKALDPTSVVRESEYAAAARSGNIFAGAFARFNGYLKPEGGFLPENVKEAFYKILGEKISVSSKQVKAIYKDRARRIDKITGLGDGEEYLTDYTEIFNELQGVESPGQSTAPAGVASPPSLVQPPTSSGVVESWERGPDGKLRPKR